MDPRFKKLSNLLIEYSLGNYDAKIKLSGLKDEVDAFISSVNMLGEELKSTAISRNYFNNILDSVSDTVFVLNKQGIILNVNKSVYDNLLIPNDTLIGKKIDDFFSFANKKSLFAKLKAQLSSRNKLQINEPVLGSINSRPNCIVTCSISYLTNSIDKKTGYILTVRDVTKQVEIDNLILRTIIDTQEKERIRFSKDIHDSLGQQLSAVKFYVGALGNMYNLPLDKKNEIVVKSNNAITEVLSDLRNICFNLMPKTLQTVGLKEAVNELCRKVVIADELSSKVDIDKELPDVSKNLEFAIFRIIQEFINNSQKYARSNKITIKIGIENKKLMVELKDNGLGFDVSAAEKKEGMGLLNVKSRVRSYNGTITISSVPKKGTTYLINIPL